MRATSNRHSIDIPAIVDTGTQFTIVSAEYALGLDIDIHSGNRKIFSPTRGGALIAWGHNLEVTLFGERFECEMFFSEERLTRSLLGRDILAETQLGLREHHGQLFLFEDSYRAI